MYAGMSGQTCVSLLCVCLWLLAVGSGQEELESVEDIAGSSWQQAYNENQKLLVLLYRSEGCDLCPRALDQVSQMLGQPEIPAGVDIAKSSDPELIAKIGVRELPKLVFLRDKSMATYDGQFELEDLLEWTQLAVHRATHKLDDQSFEHLTQASTGATTGDWLVAFYQQSCKEVIDTVESLGVRLRGRMNVAKVHTSDNPALAQRFKVSQCPSIILFKQGRMYRYDLPVLDVGSLRSFVDGFYKNAKAEAVPLQKSHFDFVTETIADFIKEQLEGENSSRAVAVVTGLAVVFLLTILCCCGRLMTGGKKQKTE